MFVRIPPHLPLHLGSFCLSAGAGAALGVRGHYGSPSVAAENAGAAGL